MKVVMSLILVFGILFLFGCDKKIQSEKKVVEVQTSSFCTVKFETLMKTLPERVWVYHPRNITFNSVLYTWCSLEDFVRGGRNYTKATYAVFYPSRRIAIPVLNLWYFIDNLEIVPPLVEEVEFIFLHPVAQ
ncbi:MAG: hypothetical protein QXG39_07695 [Candidatus Aenigmatarchaeota archaeon]